MGVIERSCKAETDAGLQPDSSHMVQSHVEGARKARMESALDQSQRTSVHTVGLSIFLGRQIRASTAVSSDAVLRDGFQVPSVI